MELVYSRAAWRVDDLAPEDTRDIPFFGFVTGTFISLALWGVVAWTLWAVVVS